MLRRWRASRRTSSTWWATWMTMIMRLIRMPPRREDPRLKSLLQLNPSPWCRQWLDSIWWISILHRTKKRPIPRANPPSPQRRIPWRHRAPPSSHNRLRLPFSKIYSTRSHSPAWTKPTRRSSCIETKRSPSASRNPQRSSGTHPKAAGSAAAARTTTSEAEESAWDARSPRETKSRASQPTCSKMMKKEPQTRRLSMLKK